jgi:hypothetical protein
LAALNPVISRRFSKALPALIQHFTHQTKDSCEWIIRPAVQGCDIFSTSQFVTVIRPSEPKQFDRVEAAIALSQFIY